MTPSNFAQIRDAAAKKRIKLYPISYGRAQALEGIIKMAKRGEGKAKKKAAAKKKTGRGPGRPKGSRNKPRGRIDTSSLEGLVSHLQSLQTDRDQAVRKLDQIRKLLA